MSLFVDTSGFYALMVATEAKHAAVKKSFAVAAERGRPLVTTSYVLLETVALLQHRIGLEPVRDLDAGILPLLSVRYVDASLHQRGLTRLFRVDQRRVSLVDAVSFEAMEADGITDVLGLDVDFAAAGFRLVP